MASSLREGGYPTKFADFQKQSVIKNILRRLAHPVCLAYVPQKENSRSEANRKLKDYFVEEKFAYHLMLNRKK